MMEITYIGFIAGFFAFVAFIACIAGFFVTGFVVAGFIAISSAAEAWTRLTSAIAWRFLGSHVTDHSPPLGPKYLVMMTLC